jgi:hypothetical protein
VQPLQGCHVARYRVHNAAAKVARCWLAVERFMDPLQEKTAAIEREAHAEVTQLSATVAERTQQRDAAIAEAADARKDAAAAAADLAAARAQAAQALAQESEAAQAEAARLRSEVRCGEHCALCVAVASRVVRRPRR